MQYIRELLACLIAISVSAVNYAQAPRSSVYFAHNSFTLDARATEKVDSLSKLSFRASVFILKGYSDSVGSLKFNDELALKRVQAVKKRMTSRGVPPGKIRTQSYGERVPVNKNMDERQRALNRRVSIDMVYAAAVKSVTITPSKTVQIVITGTVLSEDQKPLEAEITLHDSQGKELKKTTSDKKGTYAMVVNVDEKQDYRLTYYHDSAFISSKQISASHPSKPFTNLRTVLPALKQGKKYTLENLNFFASSAELLPASRPSLEALHKLMRKNKTLVIRIEGHVNNPKTNLSPATSSDLQELSEERAKMVYDYLLFKKIPSWRMSAAGLSDTEMLFPEAGNEAEMLQNRRVEIKVISLKGKKPE